MKVTIKNAMQLESLLKKCHSITKVTIYLLSSQKTLAFEEKIIGFKVAQQKTTILDLIKVIQEESQIYKFITGLSESFQLLPSLKLLFSPVSQSTVNMVLQKHELNDKSFAVINLINDKSESGKITIYGKNNLKQLIADQEIYNEVIIINYNTNANATTKQFSRQLQQLSPAQYESIKSALADSGTDAITNIYYLIQGFQVNKEFQQYKKNIQVSKDYLQSVTYTLDDVVVNGTDLFELLKDYNEHVFFVSLKLDGICTYGSSFKPYAGIVLQFDGQGHCDAFVD